MQDRLDSNPAFMRARRETVEHPFATLEAWTGSTYFLIKKLKNVYAEMSLHTSAYNVKRVMKILGTGALIAALA